MKKLLALLTAAVATLTSAWAATPVAVWDGFTGADGELTKGDYSWTKSANTTVEDGKLVIGSDGGLTMTTPTTSTIYTDRKVTIIMDVEDIPDSAVTLYGFTNVQTQPAATNRVSLDFNGGKIYQHWNYAGSYGEATFDRTTSHRIAYAYQGARGVGSTTYVDGTQSMNNTGLQASSGNITTLFVGNYFNGTAANIAEGMKISRIALFDAKLSAAEVAAYEFNYEGVAYTCTVDGETATWSPTLGTIRGGDTIEFTGTGTVTLPEGAAKANITIGADVTLVLSGGSISKSFVTNNGTIKVVGGTLDDPVVINEDGSANTGIGKVVIAENSVAKIHATGGNKLYNVTGASADSSTLLMTTGQDWGMTDGTTIRSCKVVINHAFWWERKSAFDATVDFDIGNSTVNFGYQNESNEFAIRNITGTGTISPTGTPTLVVNPTEGSEFAGTCNAKIKVASGTFKSTKTSGIGSNTIELAENTSLVVPAELAAGKVITNVAGKIASFNSTTKTYSLVPIAATVNGTPYATYAAAKAACTDGATLVITADITLNSFAKAGDHANVGCIEIAEGVTVTGFLPDSAATVPLKINGTLKLVDGYTGDSRAAIIPILSGSGTIEDGIVANGKGATPTVKIQDHSDWEGSFVYPEAEADHKMIIKLSIGKNDTTYYYTNDEIYTALRAGTEVTNIGFTSDTRMTLDGDVIVLKTYTVTLKEFEHTTIQYRLNQQGEKIAYTGAITVKHGDRVDYEYVADEGYEITDVTAGLRFSSVTKNITVADQGNVVCVVEPITPPKTATELFLEAIAAGDSEIALTGDVTVPSVVVISGTTTIDLAGHKLTATAYGNNYLIVVNNGAKLTITDSAEGGVIEYLPYTNFTKTSSMIKVLGELVVEGGTLKSDYSVVKVDEDPGKGKFTLNGGTLEVVGSYDGLTYTAMVWGDAILNAGTIKGKVQVLASEVNKVSNFGTVTVNGGSYDPDFITLIAHNGEHFPIAKIASSITDLTVVPGTAKGYLAVADIEVVDGTAEEGYVVKTLAIKSADLPGAEEVPAADKDAYNEWAAANGITADTSAADATVAATAFVMGVTVADGQTIAQAAEAKADDLLEEVATTDSTDFAAELQAGELSAETVAAFEEAHPGLTIGLVVAEEIPAEEGKSAFYKLSITIKTPTAE